VYPSQRLAAIRGRNLRPPDCDAITVAATSDLAAARIQRRRVLGGLINEYQWTAMTTCGES
jgi:hypothetical protein